MKPHVETSPTDVAQELSASAGIALEIHHRAIRTPHAEAVVDGEVGLAYATLNAAAAGVAQELERLGVTAGQAVAVALPRSWRLVCVMLGILRLGAQVVPLDTQSPAERRHFILRDSAAVALVHDRVHETAESVAGLPQHVKALAADTLLTELPDAATAATAGAALEAPSDPGEVSFLFYTSGTTGQPKGVEVRDAGVRRLAQPGYIRSEPGLRYACLANPAFDALSFEVWVPLLTGGCCVILSDGDVRTPERLAATLRHERVDTLFVTAALFNAVVTAVPDCFAAAGEVLVGGEQLDARTIRRWYRDNPDSGTRLLNGYGPTEASTFALCHPIPRDFDGAVVPIGRPLPQTGAVLVVPGQERVAAPGEVAELLLSGPGLAAGYRNLPEETERRFVRLAWLDGGAERHYRTGDLVRVDDEGLVEYVGRTDRQVKVRGFRIEPGEVERRVLTHPAVQRAHVCTRRAGQEGPNELLAFVVLRQELSYEEFDSHLAAHLPAYMRPHHIHLVAELPLNANGKIDEAALLRQSDRPWRPASPGPEGPAMTETEHQVVELAEEILGTTGLGLGDRWIASGGDSLKALRFCFAVRQRWGCVLSQAAVLHGDLAAVARSVATVRPGEEPALPTPVVSGARSAPATSEQQRLWLLQRRTPGSRAYSVNQIFRVDGPVDTAGLRRALRGLVTRHEALRTSFGPGPDGLEQTVGEPYDPWHEPGPQPAWDEEEAHAFADTFFAEPFDLAVPRMLRACWLPRDDGGTLLLHLHHIAVDGWSLSVLLDDLSAAYSESGRPEAPAPTPLDFAVWQSDRFAGPAYHAQRDELLAFYRGLEEPLDPLDPLPAQDSGPAPRAHLLHTSLDVVRRAQVDQLCAEFGLTRFQVLLSVFSWCLYGVTGLVRPRVAAPVAGRPVREFENSTGMMANTVLLPLTVAPGEDLRSHLARTGTDTGRVLGCQDVAFTDVLTGWEGVGDSTPFDFLFVLENTDFGALRLPGCVQRPLWWAAPEAKCPMTVSVVEHADGLDVLWEYAEDRFTGEDVEAMAELFRRGVDALAAGGRSTARELVLPYRLSLPQHGRGPAPEPGFTTIAEGFGRQVARTPDAPAVVTADGDTLSYVALDARAAALATELAGRYPIPADGSPCRAALYLDPSVEHVVALLALARLNVTAVPLDPSYPADVLRRVLEQIDPLCVLTTRDSSTTLDTLLPDGVERHLVVPPVESDGTSPSYDGGHTYDRRPDHVPTHDGARPLYTLFTSGSTGVPKGVQIHDRTLSDLIRWQSGPGGLTAPAATQQFSMLAFDVSFQEIFGTLCTGGSLQLIRPEWRQDVPALLDRLDSAGTERIFMPYVALHLLAEYAVRLNRYPSRLREVVTAGEQLVCTDSIRRWFSGLPGARLFNHYGPTETHVVSALCLEGNPGQWPERPAIGRPVAGADLRVVDAQGDPVPTGRTGELLIGGTMTTRCYLDEPAPDDTRFVELPGAGLFYRSGDRAFFDREGLLHYAGRDDQQIKLSGHRLELGSVEAALLRHPAVVNAVVTRDGEQLTAGLEIRGETPSADELTAHLSALLPSYVRVDRFRKLEKLPRTPSGKLDRQSVVRAPGEEIRRFTRTRTGLSAEEERLTAAFEEVTGSVIAPDQTFFEAGASSLALMRFHLRCTTTLGLRFSVADLFEHVTVRALARHLTAPPPLTPSLTAPRPFTTSAAEHDGPPEPGEPIAVVGMAVRVPGAPDLAAFWELVVSGGTGIRRIDAPEGVIGAHSTLDGMLEFDPGHFGISPQEARLMDPQQRHLLMAGVQALAHAGVADTSATRVGMVAGAGENTYFQSLLREAGPDRLPDGFQLALHHEKDFLATKVAYHLGLTGPVFSAQTACSSSLVAVHLAAGLLRQGEADVMLAGGVLIDPGLTGGYRYRPQHIFSADGDCRPFSDDATGTVGASGVGVVVLKTLRRARRDGDTVYALVTGSAINNDGAAKMSYTAPSLAGQREVIRTALSRAGRTGADLGYVEAHGTGTRLGDPIEVGALRQAFDVSESGRCALSSVKSQLGHMGAAAGVVGLVRAVLAVHHGTLPPNLNFRAFNPEIGPDPAPFYVPAEATPWPEGRERVAAVSSFGIGGTNAHVIVEQDTAPGPVATGEVPACLVLSASTADALAADAARIADYLQLQPERYEFVLRHLQAGRVARRLRAAAPVADVAAAGRWLRAVAAGTVPPGTADPDAVTVSAAGRTARDLAEDWAAGRPVDWEAGPAPAPWDFPPPSFSLTEHDFDRLPGKPREIPATTPLRLPRENWLHQPHWVRLRRAAVADTGVPACRASTVVVVASENTPRTALTSFEAVASRVIQVHPAGAFARRGPNAYDVDPADPASVRRLLDALSEDGFPVSADTEWVHALPLDVTGPVGPGTLEHARHTCLDSTAALAQALAGRNGSPRVWWLSYGARPVTGTVDRPELALLAGPVEVAPQESALDGHWFDLPDGDLTRWAGHVASVIAGTRETGHPDGPDLPRQLALRQGYWWRQDTTSVPEPEGTRSPVPAGADTVHLVLGGTGGIGRAIAAWLLEHTRGRVLLLSRNPRLPEELNGWAHRIGLVPADLATMTVHEVAAAVAGHTARLDGVIHAAGLGHGGLLVRRDATAMRDAAAVRERGALVIEHLIGAFRPEIAVYCSSMSALLGGVGQSDYAAGASLLDGFAHHRATETETTVRIGIDWDIWNETGMATRVVNPDSRHQAHLTVGLTTEEGKAVFAHALALQLPQLLVSTTDIDVSRAFYAPTGIAAPPSRSGPVHPTDGEEEALVVGSDVGGSGERADTMARVIRDLLGVDELDPEDSLYDLGADSLTLISLIARIEDDYGIEFDLASFSHRVSLTEILKHIEAALTSAEPTTEPTTGATAEAAGGTSRVVLDIWQEGTGPAVLCLVHPVGGDIQAYRSLVAALGPAPTVCLIADPALRDTGMPAWSLTEQARHYDAELRERFGGPDHRLHLAGWSYGARVAMEMAGLAESAGRPLESLHLLDPPPPEAEVLVAAYDEAHLDRVFAAELGAGASSLPTEHAQAYAERLARCCRANLRSLGEHRVRPLVSVPTYLWLAEHPTAGMPTPVNPQDPDRQWNTCLPPSAVRRYLPTDHYGIVAAPHVDTVAETIRATLASPGAGDRGTADL
ncbi:amino acid adenylation domain-containing protein [Streptomyces umbrinus]|uniref:non-ribosomal peptide synthetase n=1 Tax=Streptomyces umbrinus TaxID=67370 RepID=UPI00167C6AB6|nr:non-ribosomal peptide synthetase [Streptomyces umbrinus]MCR3729658.1 amino acid adenylation domain-containing protein [Streptomyces umbrinus]GHH59688.1 non-ribosomal peptide synthetase [Streptomyces umbrinus]